MPPEHLETAPPATRSVRLKADIRLEWTIPAVPADVPDCDVIVQAWSALSNLIDEQMGDRNRAEFDIDVRVVKR